MSYWNDNIDYHCIATPKKGTKKTTDILSAQPTII